MSGFIYVALRTHAALLSLDGKQMCSVSGLNCNVGAATTDGRGSSACALGSGKWCLLGKDIKGSNSLNRNIFFAE